METCVLVQLQLKQCSHWEKTNGQNDKYFRGQFQSGIHVEWGEPLENLHFRFSSLWTNPYALKHIVLRKNWPNTRLAPSPCLGDRGYTTTLGPIYSERQRHVISLWLIATRFLNTLSQSLQNRLQPPTDVEHQRGCWYSVWMGFYKVTRAQQRIMGDEGDTMSVPHVQLMDWTQDTQRYLTLKPSPTDLWTESQYTWLNQKGSSVSFNIRNGLNSTSTILPL